MLLIAVVPINVDVFYVLLFQTKSLLEELAPFRTFDPFNVTVHKMRTDPDTSDMNEEGVFYYLFKVGLLYEF